MDKYEKQEKMITDLMKLVQKLQKEKVFDGENFNKLKGAIKDLEELVEDSEKGNVVEKRS